LRRPALLARLLAATRSTRPTSPRHDAPDESAARRAGELLAKTRTHDIVDALLVGLARDGDTIVTSDPDDLERLLAASGTRATVLPA
jgi:hypothetical protein